MDERLQIVFSRRSIRQYTDRPMSEADITSPLCIGHPAEEKEPRTPYHLAQAHRNRW